MSNFQKKLRRRQNKFKQKSTRGNSRVKRAELTVRLSKNRREERLMKRRNMGRVLTNSNTNIRLQNHGVPSIKKLPQIIKGINSRDLNLVRRSVQSIRKLISVVEDPPTEKFESLWIISNLCSGTHEECKYIVDLDAIPLFFNHLSSKDANIVEQAVWALGNVVGDCKEFRDLVLNQPNCFKTIIGLFSIKHINMDIIQNIIWILSTMCSYKPRLEYSKTLELIPIFSRLINHRNNGIVVDCLYGLQYISDGDSKNIKEILQQGCVPTLIQLLSNRSPKIQLPAIKTIGNLLSGPNIYTDHLLEEGLLTNLKDLINSPRTDIVKCVCWTLSNITAGNQSQITQVIRSGYLPHVARLMSSQNKKIIRKEACWIMSNIVYGGTALQISKVVKEGSIELFLQYLKISQSSRNVIICLEALNKILTISQIEAENLNCENHCVKIVEENDGVQIISKFINHKNVKISNFSSSILENYLNDDQKEEKENLEQYFVSKEFEKEHLPDFAEFDDQVPIYEF
ncbi:importin subunit alpha [Anaeramoeba flamelloides]|uniref:Importin subunit alpha n=1 Tax=Anaeramoeba flamelloides TaxID=1746091 RepID=A0AAV8AGY4_9EUKA|nr:importin subunit alpha [Anaeramoeba flamelloides]